MGGANASTQRDLIPADPWQPGPSVLTFLAMARHYEPSPCCVDIGHGHRTDADKDGAGRRLVDGGYWMLDARCRMPVPSAGYWMVDTGAGWWSIDDDRRSEGMQLLIRFDCGGGGNRWSEINSLTRYQN
ncbi:GD15649 [Drosophila simulans]|uniref:GD15649 n=1 Tax=Drosophila simulans TaxID=7240 RepID=B4R6X6_DROSI|nr:GD15649 [Drosophila simulans]